jgi:hypothetical protein
MFFDYRTLSTDRLPRQRFSLTISTSFLHPHPSPRFFEIAIFKCLGISVRVFPGSFVLVLSDSGTRTRCGILEYEYDYHFIEYEYEGSRSIATSKPTVRLQRNPTAPLVLDIISVD